MKIFSAILAFCFLFSSPSFAKGSRNDGITFCCSPKNDLFTALASQKYRRFDTPLAAIEHAKVNSAVLILADGYPENFTQLPEKELLLAQEKALRLFVEFPKALPEMEFGSIKTTEWERGVLASTNFGTALRAMRILAIHDCRYLPLAAKNPWLVVARVAGFDKAVYGLPTNAAPILFEIPEKKMLVATTKLSGFITARFAPAKDWEIIWQKILATLDPENAPHQLEWAKAVRPAFSANEKLPKNLSGKHLRKRQIGFSNRVCLFRHRAKWKFTKRCRRMSKLLPRLPLMR